MATKLTIQFIGDDNILIPGQGTVSARGNILDIAPGELGEKFRYMSPEEQKDQFGHQVYVLIAAADSRGRAVEHPDLNVAIDGPAFIDPAFVANWPAGVHDYMVARGAPIYRSGGSEMESPRRRTRGPEEVSLPTRKKKLKKKKAA